MIGITVLSFCLGGLLGSGIMALASVSSKGSMCEECIGLHEAQKPAKVCKHVSETFGASEVTYALLEDLPKHTPIRKKDRRPYFKKHNK